MQQDDQQSPGYDYEPPGVDHIALPVSVQLTNYEEYFLRGVFGQGGSSVVFRVRDRNGHQYAAKVLTERASRHSIQRELETYQRIAQNPHINLLTLHLSEKLLNPSPGYRDDVFITEACEPSIKDIMMTNVTFTIKYDVDTNLAQPSITMNDLQIKLIDYGNSLPHSTPGIPEIYKLVQPQNLRAPEIFMGIPHSEKTDVWSMGCLMGQMYLGKSIFMSRTGATQIEIQQSQIELIVNRMNATIPEEMIEIKCTLDLNFLTNRDGNNHQDFSLNLMRDMSDFPLFEFLLFVLVFNPVERPSFEELLNHKFLANC